MSANIETAVAILKFGLLLIVIVPIGFALLSRRAR